MTTFETKITNSWLKVGGGGQPFRTAWPRFYSFFWTPSLKTENDGKFCIFHGKKSFMFIAQHGQKYQNIMGSSFMIFTPTHPQFRESPERDIWGQILPVISKKSGQGYAGATAYTLVVLSPAASAGCPQWGWERPPSSVAVLCACFHAAEHRAPTAKPWKKEPWKRLPFMFREGPPPQKTELFRTFS